MIYYYDISKIGKDLTGKKDVPILINEQALFESIYNILLTEPGERPMNPEFGCRLDHYVFEPLDYITANSIKSEIIYALQKFEGRLSFLDVSVEPDEDNNTYIIDIYFSVSSIITNQSINLKLNKVR